MPLTSDQIFDIVETIADTSSTKEKEAIIKHYSNDEVFKKVLKYTYDPTKMYGIRDIPDYSKKSTHNEEFTTNTWNVLDKLVDHTLSGNDARLAVRIELEYLSVKSAELLQRIILKDLRAGFGDSIINKACKGLIPDFPYMRCSGIDKINRIKFPAISQEKCDGMYQNAQIFDTAVLSSRQGKLTPTFKSTFEILVDELIEYFPHNNRIMGEFRIKQYNQDGTFKILERQVSNGTMNHVCKGDGDLSGNEEIIFSVWDIVPEEEVLSGKGKEGYIDRFNKILDILHNHEPKQIDVPEWKIVYSLQEAFEHCAEVLARGGEGTVLKNLDGKYKDGTSTDQVKLKLKFQVELRVKGYTAGYGKNADTFGSLLCESECGILKTGVASGLKDKPSEGVTRKEILDNWKDWENAVITVEANAVSIAKDGSYSLSYPVFIEKRNDKSVADTLERIKQQQQEAIKTAAMVKV